MPAQVTVNVSLPGEGETASEVTRLERELSALPSDAIAEIWVDHDRFPALCVLVNGENTFLTFFRYDGDAGFYSLNPEHTGQGDVMIEYELSNGQVDKYPLSSSYPASKVKEALIHFARTKRVPSWLEWGNASFDGASSPNEPFEEI